MRKTRGFGLSFSPFSQSSEYGEMTIAWLQKEIYDSQKRPMTDGDDIRDDIGWYRYSSNKK